MKTPSTYVQETTTLFWFRRDLRITDNAGLYYALKQGKEVLPIFIFDTVLLDQLDDPEDRRVDFIHQTVAKLKSTLEQKGSSLLVLHGDPVAIFSQLNPATVYANHDADPYSGQRDEAVSNVLHTKGSVLKTYKDHVIFEKDEIVKDNGKPYTIFTPYSKKWKAKLNAFYVKKYPLERYLKHLKPCQALPFPSIEQIGFKRTGASFSEPVIKQRVITAYDAQRDYPSKDGTTRLSLHLRYGTVSIRKLVQLATKKNQTWLNELIWRDFYHMILWHFPHVTTQAFKPLYDLIEWRNNENEFQAWCEGKTGYPIVDAGMRELNETGFMHNRVRMIVASFLTKHLLIDWRWGEAYFAKKLLDYDLAANNGGWQWAAGSGCDAAPYFRIFNPELQTKKFDPDHLYIKKWVPEAGTSEYPQPIIEHTFARERVLRAYKTALTLQR